MNEVQVIGLLLATDQIHEPDVLMVNAASAATLISDIPWNGPVGCVRVGQIDGEFVTNPTHDEMLDSDLDLIYVGSETEMLMIEGSAEFISDERFYEALEYGQQAIQPIIAAQKELAKLAGKEKKDFPLVLTPAEITEFCEEHAAEKVKEALGHDSYTERKLAIEAIAKETTAALEAKLGEDKVDGNDVARAFDEIQEKLYRQNILETGKRVDGRGAQDLRTITCDTGVLPRVHGSAVFNRGETQALVISTLGTSRDVQDIDSLTGGATSKSFILHYNFPPFSTGEAGRFGFTGRREIGHGALAERSLLPILPPEDEFPYAIRVVSGMTQRLHIHGLHLRRLPLLMDAGVPITAPCAGISTGLVTEKDADGKITKHVISPTSSVLKTTSVTWTSRSPVPDGITGFQLDLKISGLPFDVTSKRSSKTVTRA